MKDIILEFRNYLVGKNRSLTTIESYVRSVQKFDEWNRQQTGESLSTAYRGVTVGMIEAYSNHLGESGNSASTICQRISALKTLFTWLYKKNMIDIDVSSKVERPTIGKKIVKVINDEEVDSILDDLKFLYKSRGNKNVSYRNMVVFHLFLNSGLRKSELINLKTTDVDLKNNRILVRGKGNKQRYGYFNNETKNMLVTYLNEYRGMFKDSEIYDEVFITDNGKLSPEYLWKVITNLFDRSGLKDKGYTVHTLRKTCATMLFKNGVDVSTIKEVLGHEKVETTYIYLMLSEESKKEALMNVKI